jgi:2,4-dienoyl-CoA reductase-like NADH-dependent reductase (Old Yellow Enzyme family)
MTHLFDPLAIREITFANRVFVSPHESERRYDEAERLIQGLLTEKDT